MMNIKTKMFFGLFLSFLLLGSTIPPMQLQINPVISHTQDMPNPLDDDFTSGFTASSCAGDYYCQPSENGLWNKVNSPMDMGGGNVLNFVTRNVSTKKSNLELSVPGNTTEGAQIDSTTSNFFYGRYEIKMKVSNVPGVVNGFFIYNNDEKIADNPYEIDVEFLSKDPQKINFTIHTGINKKVSKEVSVPGNKKLFTKYHVFRFDWWPDRVEFYLDGGDPLITMCSPSLPADSKIECSMQAEIPQKPGTLIINNWAGIPGWGDGPPKKTAIMLIDRVKYTPAEKSPLDVVFVMDTSGSMDDDISALCSNIQSLVNDLNARGISVNYEIFGIMDTRECSTGTVVQKIPVTTVNNEEDWGRAISDLARAYSWMSNATRVIVPMSDEPPEDGEPCDMADEDVISDAVVAAQENDVFVSPILSSGYQEFECVEPLAIKLASGTGGTVFYSSTPAKDLADSIMELLENIVAAEMEIVEDASSDLTISDFAWIPEKPEVMEDVSLIFDVDNLALDFQPFSGLAQIILSTQDTTNQKQWDWSMSGEIGPILEGDSTQLYIDKFWFTNNGIDQVQACLVLDDPDANQENNCMTKQVIVEPLKDPWRECATIPINALVFAFDGLTAGKGSAVIDWNLLLMANAGNLSLACTNADEVCANAISNFFVDIAFRLAIEGLSTPVKFLLTMVKDTILLFESSVNCGEMLGVVTRALWEQFWHDGVYVNGVIAMSPVYVEVVDNQGRRVGFSQDGTVLQEIPDAVVEERNGEKVVLYPGTGTEKVNIYGTGQGTFDLIVNVITADQKGHSIIYEDVNVTPGMVGELDMENNSTFQLGLDDDHDGKVDRKVLPAEAKEISPVPMKIGEGTVSIDQSEGDGSDTDQTDPPGFVSDNLKPQDLEEVEDDRAADAFIPGHASSTSSRSGGGGVLVVGILALFGLGIFLITQRKKMPSDHPMGMKIASLHIISGHSVGTVITIAQDGFSIGRSSKCDLQLLDPAVSRLHIRLRYAQGAWFIQDQESTTGTFINRQRVVATRLNNGDQIMIGGTILVFQQKT